MTARFAVTDEQLLTFSRRVHDLEGRFRKGIVDPDLTLEHLQRAIEDNNPFVITNIRQEWQEFYRRYFRMTVDFTKVVIPDDLGGFERVIFIPKGLTPISVIKALKKKFKVSLYTENLDRDIRHNARVAWQSYAIRLRERREADREWKNTLADQFKEEGVNFITLMERLVYELKYYCEIDRHLDVNNWTLCVGSQCTHGRALGVRWTGDRLVVDCNVFDVYADNSCSREVVSA